MNNCTSETVYKYTSAQIQKLHKWAITQVKQFTSETGHK